MSDLIITLILGSLIGLSAGYLGTLMVLRRMSLVGDALSHVALPGLALGLLFHFNPFLGAFSALFIAILLIWIIENKTHLPVETLVGVFFTLSLAIGLLITPQPDLLEALFGDIGKVGLLETGVAIALAMLVFGLTHVIYRRFILSTISNDLAQSAGVATKKLDFIFLLLVALIVSLGIKIVGTLLMGALVIIPAAASKNLSHRLNSYRGLGAVFGLASAALGIYWSTLTHVAPGPMVVLTGSAFFLLSLLFKKR